MIRLHVTIQGCELLLTPNQVEQIIDITNGCEMLNRSYKGKDKGIFGTDSGYDIKFGFFDASGNLGGLPILTQAMMDKYTALIAMREKEVI